MFMSFILDRLFVSSLLTFVVPASADEDVTADVLGDGGRAADVLDLGRVDLFPADRGVPVQRRLVSELGVS